MPHTIRASRLRHLLCAVVGLILSVAPEHARVGAVQDSGVNSGGQSITVLPDGRRLRIGGDSSRGLVVIEDSASPSVVTLPISPLVPRSWHTATLLADGTVLLVGGVDSSGRVISAPERFNPATQAFELLPAAGVAARAKHTATLLTDGRVLIAGGETAAGANDAEVWDPDIESASVLTNRMLENRVEHEAALLPDGRVLLQGGQPSADRSTTSEVFDPATNRFEPFAARALESPVPAVVVSSPADGAVDVPAKARVVIRFSLPMASASVTTATVSLSGPDGPVNVLVVPAEAGMLAFVTPLEPLTPATAYTFTVNGPATTDGRSLRPFSIRFRTAEERDVTPPGDLAEDWFPNPGDGRGWRINQPDSPWQKLPPLQAPAGVTALAGQALRLTGQPLADVTLIIRGRSARTDRTGRFLLLLNGFGSGRYQLEIEGATASRPGRIYGFYEAGLNLTAGQTNVLPYTIWMSKTDTTHAVQIASPTTSETIITTPKIPGLELHLPRGTIIKDRDGRIVREVSITPIPVDRPPFPLPEIEVPVYFTIQPGGAFVYGAGYRPQKARLIYPNIERLGQDVVANFWHYDPVELGWYVYGAGKVKGTRIVPDPGVGIYEFCGAMINTGLTPAGSGPPPWWWPFGEPVDVSTGLFVLQKVDLALPDTIPLTLKRTYRPADNAVRPFGIGATHDYAMFLWSAHQYTEVDLILPDSARVHYVRTSSGTGFTDAVFEHTTSPTRFYKSQIAWNGNGWDLTLRDGTVYVFGNEAPLQSIRDRFGNTVTLTWSSSNAYGSGTGKITRVTSPNGRWIALSYDQSNRITEAHDNVGRTVGYEYDATGRLWKVTDARGGVTEYTYDTSNRLLTIKDARGIVYLTNEYNTDNRVTRQTQADSTTFEFSYTVSDGKVTQADITDPRGHTTRVAFNGNGYPTSFVEALGLSEHRTTTYVRDGTSNRVTSVTDPLNRVTSYGYDTNGNLTSVTRLSATPDAVTATFGYGVFDLLTSITDPLNHTTSIAYDAQGRIQSATNALSHQTTFQTNLAGQVLSVTNPLSHTTTLTHEGADLAGAQTPLGHVTSQFTDAAGRVVRTTDPNGAITRFEYNAHNQVTKITDARGGETTFTYDGNGNLLTLTDARGKTTTWTYDDMDRVATRTDPLTRQESFVYDENGNLTQWTDRKGQVTTYEYDALDRRTFVGFGTTGTPPTYASTIATTYDAGDRATAIVDSAAGTIGRTYDLLDRLMQETTPEGTISYTYDAADRRATMTVAGQTAVSYGYDNADRLTGLTQGSASVALASDEAGRRTSLTLPNGIVVGYTYDDDSRLAGIEYKLGSATLGDLTYTYDAAGRRTSVGGSYARTGLPAALTSATYDDANQIATFGGTSFTYDANGNVTNDGVRSYTWNARNELASLTGPVNGSFAYDGVGRRRSKTIAGTTTQFLYDGLNPVQELSGGTPAANLLTGLRIDEFFARTDVAGARNHLSDVLGSTVALTDDSGAVQTEYTYEPFGATTQSGASSGNTFGFTGREADGTGLLFYRARFYDPKVQRFVGEDPLRLAAGSNLFSFVGNQPTVLVDPLGLKPIDSFGGNGGGDDDGGGGGGAGAGAGAGGAGAGGGGGGRGGRGGGDRWYGHDDRDFQDWYHKEWKRRQGPDATQDEMDDAYREWERQGKPKRDPRGDWDRTKRHVKEMTDWVRNHRTQIIVTAAGVVIVGGLIIVATGGTGTGAVIVAVGAF